MMADSLGRDKTQHVPAPMTARMLLASVLGEEHDLHSVAKWAVGDNGALQLTCTCGGFGTTPFSPESLRALRNMKFVEGIK